MWGLWRMAEEGPMAQISLARSEGALKGWREGGREENGGGKEGEIGGEVRWGEEHKDRGRETVKQRIEMVSALSLWCPWERLYHAIVDVWCQHFSSTCVCLSLLTSNLWPKEKAMQCVAFLFICVHVHVL